MFAETFRKQERGEQLMLVADVNGSLVAQAWFDLERATNRNAVYLWAMRVIPWLHGFGIGSRLLHYAGNVASECGFTAVELTVDKGNARARKLYERFGFQMIDEIEELEPYTNREGKTIQLRRPRYLMERPLNRE